MQLFIANVRRSAAAEIRKSKLSSLEGARPAVQFVFFNQGVEVDLDLGSILVRVDFEITKLAALPTERNVDVKAEWIVDARRFIEGRERFANELRLPLRERRIVRNEVVADIRARLSVFC